MQSRTNIEIADRRSRIRARMAIVATSIFAAIQFFIGPYTANGPESAQHLTRGLMWALNAGLLLLVLAVAGGMLNIGRIAALVNDEVSQANSRTSAATGFWVAMITAIALFVVPASESMTGRQVAYVVATFSIVVALLTFALLERRAHGDE